MESSMGTSTWPIKESRHNKQVKFQGRLETKARQDSLKSDLVVRNT